MVIQELQKGDCITCRILQSGNGQTKYDLVSISRLSNMLRMDSRSAQVAGEESYCIRFTPRKPSSNWSTVNIKKVEVLMKQGLMQPAGIEAFNNRKLEKSRSAKREEIQLAQAITESEEQNRIGDQYK